MKRQEIDSEDWLHILSNYKEKKNKKREENRKKNDQNNIILKVGHLKNVTSFMVLKGISLMLHYTS